MEWDVQTLGTLAIRGINAVLWTAVIYEVLRSGQPLPRLVRNLSATVILFGMWALFLGGLTTVGAVPGDVARFIYTTFTAYAALVALAIVTDAID
jgi:hypothetical protein